MRGKIGERARKIKAKRNCLKRRMHFFKMLAKPKNAQAFCEKKLMPKTQKKEDNVGMVLERIARLVLGNQNWRRPH